MRALHPGDTINNRYKVIRILGAGAMGSVYLCEDLVENNIKVALKVLISENLDDQDVWAKGEYEALIRLRHPNLARVYNFGRISNTDDYFIVSEFIKGVDLYSATEYVHYDEMNEVVVQICRALEYIHSQGYVHFDIKPDNILVTRHKTLGLKDGSKVQYTDEAFLEQNRSTFSKPNVKLIDFGLAEKITGSFSFAIKGTLNYLAPEIVNGTTPDKRADLYSLGVTLYQVTNRDLPFYQDPGMSSAVRGLKRSDLFENNMKKHPEYLRTLIMKLLEEKPENRFQNAKEVIQFLNKNSGQHFALETKETQASYLYCARLVGRKKELSILKGLYERIFSNDRKSTTRNSSTGDKPSPGEPAGGSPETPLSRDRRAGTVDTPHLVVISGEMGVGKSRLVEEYFHFLRLNDVKLYSGNCYEGKSNAYQPFVEILRQMVVELGLDSEVHSRFRGDIRKLLPELVSKFNPPSERQALYSQENIFFDHLSQFFLDVAEKTPFVLTINNLHWGDEATVGLLGAIVDKITERQEAGHEPGLMLLVSQRTDDRSLEDLKILLARLKEENRLQDILLRRLKRAHLVEIIQTILNLNEIPALFMDRLEERTGGNPLFIMETLKALHVEGFLKNSDSGWTIKATNYDRIELPHSLDELLINRAQRLEPVKRELLEVMSVLNKPISPKVLGKFKRFDGFPILTHLRELEDSGLVSKLFEGGKLEFQVDQPKMQEILYSHLEPDLRRGYHGEVGSVLSELFHGHEEEVLEELAYHYQRSDQTDRALELAVRAGDRLAAIYAHDRAYEYYLYIIEKLENDLARLPLWMETHEKLGDLCTGMGRYEIAERSYDCLLQEEVREEIEPVVVSRAFRKKGRLFEIQGDYDTALRCYKEARTFVAQFDTSELLEERTRVFNCIGWVYVCMGKYEKAMTISLEGLRLVSGSVEKIELATVYNTIGSANFHKGNTAQAIEYHSRGLKIRENLENIPEVIVSLNNLGAAYLANAEYAEAMEHFRRALGASEEIGDPHGRAVTLHHLALAYFDVGQTKKAEEFLQESLRISKNYNLRNLNNQNHYLLGKILAERCDWAKAEGYFFRALTAFSKQGNRWGLCSVLLEIVEVHCKRRNYSEALALAEEAHRYAVSLDIHYLKAMSLLAKARLLRETGEESLETPLSFLSEALSTVTKIENPEIPGRIHCEMAEVLIRLRKLGEAREHLLAASEKFRTVLDRLPKEFRASYQEKHKERFSPEGSLPLAQEVPAPGDEKIGSPEEGGSSPDDNPLRHVNELMQLLPGCPRLGDFLQELLARLLVVSGAQAATIFERRGGEIREIAAAHSGGSHPVKSKAIERGAIERALSKKLPIFKEDTAVFPFSLPEGDGVAHVEGAALEDSRDQLGLQAIINLIPVAFLSLPRASDPEETPEIQLESVDG